MIHVKKPRKVADFYLAVVETKDHKPVRVILKNAEWLQFQQHLLKLWVSPSDPCVTQLVSFDKEVYEQTIEHNARWFPNLLSHDQIRDFFRPSYQESQSTMTVMMSEWQMPVIYIDDVISDRLNLRGTLKKIHIELEAEGLCFFRRRFGIRWIVKRIWLWTKEPQEEQIEDWVDREAIHQAWMEEINDFKQKLEEDRNLLKHRENKLLELEQNVETLWKNAKDLSDNSWNEEMEKISKIILKYSFNTFDKDS